jgi:2-keto-3-deoxy-L-rhamnonate aldolase RhmA
MENAPMPAHAQPVLLNPAKQKMQAGDLAIGMVVRLARSGEIARVASASGHDFIFIDMQHAIYSLETVAHIAHTALGCGVAPLVRVRSFRDPNIAVILDCGATGIVFPDINTADEAHQAVDACRFAPLGHRSVIGAYSMFNFRPLPPEESSRILNESTLVVCMIETVEGLKNLEEIAVVEGVDVLLLGLTDLLNEMGTTADKDEPLVMGAVERLTKACQANGKFAGVGGDYGRARQIQYLRMGAQFFPLLADHSFLVNAGTAAASALRELRLEAH